ncbi:MAG: SH3 domain-containing protein [Chloroflexota bacterium]
MAQVKVTASALNVRAEPSLDGEIIGTLFEGDVVEHLDTSADQKWLRVQKAGLIGWSSRKFLAPVDPGVAAGPLDAILEIADSSAIATFNWPGRGAAPRGYTRGMALVFARSHCRLQDGDEFAREMARANTGDGARDALAHYANEFAELGMDNESSGVVTLRHLFVLLLGLGMRESSGRWCEGRDRSAENVTSDTAEAGLFQTSWNAHTASPLLPDLLSRYQQRPAGFHDVFAAGVTATDEDLQNFGSGDGREFQRLSKECPAFAAEFAAIGLRHIRTHWGPINTRAAVLRPEADRMFLRVQQAVDSAGLCPELG